MQNSRRDLAPLSIRILIGGGIMVAGLLKLIPPGGIGYQNIVHEFEQLNIPMVHLIGYFVGIVESLTGLGIVIGAYTRQCTLVNMGNLLSIFAMAIFLGFIPAPLPEVAFFPFQLPTLHLSLITLAGLMSLMISGPGRYSVDETREAIAEHRR